MPENLFTIAQAADYLGVSQSTLRRWHDRKKFIPQKIDRTTGYRYYTIDQLNTYNAFRWHNETLNQPKQLSMFTFIDLFAGIGGLRLAFQNLGGVCAFSSEIDRFAQQTYTANFSERPA